MSNSLITAAEMAGVEVPIQLPEYLLTGGKNGERFMIGDRQFHAKPSVPQIERWINNGGVKAVAILRQAAVNECLKTGEEALNG